MPELRNRSTRGWVLLFLLGSRTFLFGGVSENENTLLSSGGWLLCFTSGLRSFFVAVALSGFPVFGLLHFFARAVEGE